MTVLNYVDAFRIGGNTPSAVYLGSTKVWPGFKPTDISGCNIWLDASQLNLAHGDTVITWPNLGTSGTGATRTGTPTLQRNALNGRSVVRITQGQGKFRWYSPPNGANPTGVDKDYTLVYVGRKWQANQGRIVAAWGTTANILVGHWRDLMDQAYIEGWITSSTSPSSNSLVWRLYSADASSTNVARFFSNGIMIAFGSATPARGWGGTLCLSGYSDDAAVATSEECSCEIAELVLYNRRLSDTERQTVEGYLRTKWNPVAPFTPADINSNLIGWFDADPQWIQLAGSGINQWSNRGGYMQLVQTTDANRPTFSSIDKTVTLADQNQIFVPNPIPLQFDMVFVGRPRHYSQAANWRTLARCINGAHLGIVEAGSTRYGIYNAPNGFYQAGSLTWDNVWGISYCRFPDQAVAYLSRDGGPLTTTGSTIAANGAQPTYFGAYQGPPPNQGWGDFKEVILVTVNLQDSTRQQLEGYLAWKWGLTGLLASGHPYKNVRP